MKYDWLLFDADETLFDFHRSSELAFSEVLRLHEIEELASFYPTYKRVNNLVWKEMENGIITQEELRARRFQLFLDEAGLSGDAANFNRLYLEQLVVFTDVLPGAIELLDSLKPKFKMAIITNGLKEAQRPRLHSTGLTPYFDTIVVSDEIGYSKPQREFFDYTFEQIGQPPKESVLVIGDNINSDIRGGHAYDLDTCWLNSNGLVNESRISPTYVIEKILELSDVVN